MPPDPRAVTPNFGLNQPSVGGDANIWGTLLNENFGKLDLLLRFLVPTGAILLWSGAVDAVPTGWALCDGANGTPNLKDRFVVGAGGEYAVAAVGGAKEVTLTAAQMPAHSHDAGAITVAPGGAHNHAINSTPITGTLTNISQTWGASGSASGVFSKPGPASIGTSTPVQVDNGESGRIALDATHGHTAVAAPDHAHTATAAPSASTGGGGAHENLPPYFALAYIMKLAA